MRNTFVPFVGICLLGLYYYPIPTLILLSVYIAMGCFIIGPLTYEACLYSLYPLKRDYNDYLPFLKGKNILVTGANRGVGLGIVRELAANGSNIMIACRSQIESTVNELKSIAKQNGYCESKIDGYFIDLSDFESYLSFFKLLKSKNIKIDVLVLNAGMTIYPPKQTKDNIDLMLFVNFLSNVILIKYFVKMDLFNKSGSTLPRIVTTSSDTHRWQKYKDFSLVHDYSLTGQVSHYAETKMYNQMLINYVAQKYQNKIDVYGHCPGPVWSGIARNAPIHLRMFAYAFMGILFQGIERGGKHIVYSCMQPRELYESGTYHWMMHKVDLSKDSLNGQYIKELMEHAHKIVDDLEKKYGTVQLNG